jgi:hypothetical protein
MTKTLAYYILCPFSVACKSVMFNSTGSWGRIHNTVFSSQLTNWPNRLDCSIIQLERLAGDKHSNLMSQFLSYGENKVL